MMWLQLSRKVVSLNSVTVIKMPNLEEIFHYIKKNSSILDDKIIVASYSHALRFLDCPIPEDIKKICLQELSKLKPLNKDQKQKLLDYVSFDLQESLKMCVAFVLKSYNSEPFNVLAEPVYLTACNDALTSTPVRQNTSVRQKAGSSWCDFFRRSSSSKRSDSSKGSGSSKRSDSSKGSGSFKRSDSGPTVPRRNSSGSGSSHDLFPPVPMRTKRSGSSRRAVLSPEPVDAASFNKSYVPDLFESDFNQFFSIIKEQSKAYLEHAATSLTSGWSPFDSAVIVRPGTPSVRSSGNVSMIEDERLSELLDTLPQSYADKLRRFEILSLISSLSSEMSLFREDILDEEYVLPNIPLGKYLYLLLGTIVLHNKIKLALNEDQEARLTSNLNIIFTSLK